MRWLSEGQALLGPARPEMQVAAHAPQELLAPPEQLRFVGREEADLDEVLGPADPVDVFRDPEEGVQVPQATLAVLDVRFDQIPRGPSPVHARISLLQLRIDEEGGRAFHHLLREGPLEIVVEGAVTQQETRLEERRPDGHVGPRLAYAFRYRAGRVADLQPQVPQDIENGLHRGRAGCASVGRQQEQQVHVGARRHRAAPVAPRRPHRNERALRAGRPCLLRHRRVRGRDHVVHRGSDRARAGEPVATLREQLLGSDMALGELLAQHRHKPGSKGASLRLSGGGHRAQG